MPGGHMFPLECPEDTATMLKMLFSRWDDRAQARKQARSA
jgi:carboxypeptidase C (cathepsin A)